MDKRRLRAGALELGAQLTEVQLEKFDIYLNALQTGNVRANLIGDADQETIIANHFLDSLSCLTALGSESAGLMLDLGSGAGLPGIPLAIAVPEMTVTLMDSSVKRTGFLTATIQELGLTNTRVICGRAEELGRENGQRGAYDIVVARAVAPLPALVEYALPFLKTGGRFIAQRGPKAPEETAAAARAIAELGGDLTEIKKVRVPFLNAGRYLVVVLKSGMTPDRYPRRTGVPLKRPLA